MDWPLVSLVAVGSALTLLRLWPFLARKGAPREGGPDCDRDVSGWGTG